MSIWPPIIVLTLLFFGAGSSAAKYGKQKTDSYDCIDVFVGPGILLGLLWWGNFFAPLVSH